MDPQKPGWMTTEFWLALLAQVIPVLVLLHVMPSGDVQTVTADWTQAITAIGAFAAAAVAIWRYIHSRTEIKTNPTYAKVGDTQAATGMTSIPPTENPPQDPKLNYHP